MSSLSYTPKMTLNCTRGITVFLREQMLDDDRTQICFNSRKLKRTQLLLERFSIKMPACVIYIPCFCHERVVLGIHGQVSSPSARASASYSSVNISGEVK